MIVVAVALLRDTRPVGQALGRVLRDEDLVGPRGPDATLRVSVPPSWLAESAWIELDLPRMLACAACSGGGCDLCGRSGAVATRGRKELPEIVELRLPTSERGATVRLPARGGLPESGDLTLPRGMLLLTITPGEAATEGVRRRPDEEVLAAVSEAPLALPPRPLSAPQLFAIAAALVLLLAIFSFVR